MIFIGQPHIISGNKSSRIETTIKIDDKEDILWFQVDKEYEQFLCDDRIDAYVIAILNYAMRNGHDITSECPISETLHYNISNYLIGALCQYNPNFHHTTILAPIISAPIKSHGAVGTGISRGVDSLHALASQNTDTYPKHRITHLLFNNVGSHGDGNKGRKLFNERADISRKFAKEYNLQIIVTDSNLMDVIQQNHFKSHTYSSIFPVYCLQKLFSIYYYASSGYKYHEFTLADKENTGPGSYEFISLPLFSTESLRIYSEGESKSRLDKIKTIAHYKPAHDYLEVCLTSSHNCNTCEKCVRTLLALDALGVLANFAKVFDTEYYIVHKKEYLIRLLYQVKHGSHDYIELYPFFKNEITLAIRIKAAQISIKKRTQYLIGKIYAYMDSHSLTLPLLNIYRKLKTLIK